MLGGSLFNVELSTVIAANFLTELTGLGPPQIYSTESTEAHCYYFSRVPSFLAKKCQAISRSKKTFSRLYCEQLLHQKADAKGVQKVQNLEKAVSI